MNSFCWIAYHTTCSCKKLLFTMEINWRAGRQKLANFKTICVSTSVHDSSRIELRKTINTLVTDESLEKAIVAINADQGCSAKGYYYKIIREDMYKKCCDFLEVHFLPDEPVCKGIGIPWSDEVEAIFMSVLTQHLSIAILSSTTNDIVGIRMIGIASSGPGVDPDDFGEEPVRKYFRFIRYKTGVADAFKVPQHTLANFTTYCPSYSRQTSCRF